ncbi:MAG: helix-turn-helix transcriptional regulator [Oscillibacter sp.]|nr:helix-turn-helix transcriptional regulator [Oscillibacter sp.]
MGPEIRAARKAAGLTQAEFANALGMNRATISKYENGIIEPSVAQLKKMSSVLGVQWYLLVPPEDKDQYLKADTFGMSIASYRQMTVSVGRKLTLRDQQTGRWMDVKILRDGEIEVSPHYISPHDRIMFVFYRLNNKGKEKAADAIELIAENPEYQLNRDALDEDEYEHEEDEGKEENPAK